LDFGFWIEEIVDEAVFNIFLPSSIQNPKSKIQNRTVSVV